MFISCSYEKAQTRKRYATMKGTDVSGNWALDYFGSENLDPACIERNGSVHDLRCPQAYMVLQSPDSVVPTHYHHVDQFQVVMSGGGRIGAHPVQSVSVHFSKAYTGYGPVVADKKGVDYLSLRNMIDRGASRLPEYRSEQKQLPRLNVFLEPLHVNSSEHLYALLDVECIALHTLEESGLGIWRLLMPPHSRIASPDPSTGASQYWVVLQGELILHEEQKLTPKSCVFVSEDETQKQIEAGPRGLELLVLQFPKAI